MAGMDVCYGEEGNSLTVWFDNPRKTRSSEVRGENLILNKDSDGHVIGIERRNYFDDALEEVRAGYPEPS